MDPEQLKKAKKNFTKGEGALNTHIFKWNPDYVKAVPYYSEAATLYENLGNFDMAIKAYNKLALCNEKIDDTYNAAGAYEKIAKLTLKINPDDINSSLKFFRKAGDLYRIQGNSMKYQMLIKDLASEYQNKNEPEMAIALYKELVEDVFEEENYLTGSDLIPTYLNMLVAKNKYKEAIDIYLKHIHYIKNLKKYEYTIGRCWISIISIHLILNEVEIAEEKLMDMQNDIDKPHTEEFQIAYSLIDYFKKGNPEDFLKFCRKPMFTQIESEIVKQLKKIRFDTSVVAKVAKEVKYEKKLHQNEFPIEDVKGMKSSENNAKDNNFEEDVKEKQYRNEGEGESKMIGEGEAKMGGEGESKMIGENTELSKENEDMIDKMKGLDIQDNEKENKYPSKGPSLPDVDYGGAFS